MPADDDKISLRDHFAQRFADLDRRFDTIESHRIELRDLLKETVAETQRLLVEYKKDSNEWRGLANDLIANHPTKAEVDVVVGRVELKVGLQQAVLDKLQTKGDRDAGADTKGIDIQKTVLAFIAAAGVIATFALALYLAVS